MIIFQIKIKRKKMIFLIYNLDIQNLKIIKINKKVLI